MAGEAVTQRGWDGQWATRLAVLQRALGSKTGLWQVAPCLAGLLGGADTGFVLTRAGEGGARELVAESWRGGDEATVQAMRHLLEEPEATGGVVLVRSVAGGFEMRWVIMAGPGLPTGEVLGEMADHIAGELAFTLGEAWGSLGLPEPFDQLSAKEWRVAALLQDPEGEKQMAAKSGITPHTLHSHIKAVYRKTRTRGRLEFLVALEAALLRKRVGMLRMRSQPVVAVGDGAAELRITVAKEQIDRALALHQRPVVRLSPAQRMAVEVVEAAG